MNQVEKRGEREQGREGLIWEYRKRSRECRES